MTLPRNGEGGAPTRRPSRKISAPHELTDRSESTSRNSQVPTVAAEAYPPAGRRSQWLLLMKSCVYCGYAHAHRGSPAGGLREAGCGRGEYLLQPIHARAVA